MFGRNHPMEQIHISLHNRQGDRFLLTDEHFYFNHKPLKFQSPLEAWHFLFDLKGHFDLENRLKGHPKIHTSQHSPVSFQIRDALVSDKLRVFLIHKDLTRNHQEIETLYNQIHLKLQQIIASEKSEAATIEQKYQLLNKQEKAIAHAGSAGKGLKEAGISLLTWVKDIHDITAGYKRLGRIYEAARDTQYHGLVLDWLTRTGDRWKAAEYRELVEALGFDPARISPDTFYEAWEIAQVIWHDERSQTLLTRFGKDYARAQHSLRISELAGGAAFEILLTIILTVLTAGAGAVASMATKTRLIRQLTDVGELFKDLARVQREVYEHTPRRQVRSQSGGNSFEDLPTEKAVFTRAGEPPKGEKRLKPDNTDSTADKKLAPSRKPEKTVYTFDDLESFNRAANNPSPDSRYEYGTYGWETDSLGRVTEARGKVTLVKADGRAGTDGVSTVKIGKEGVEGDIGFHLIGDQFDGPTNRLNVVPGNGKKTDPEGKPNLNQGQYAKFERAVKAAALDPANKGKSVEIKVSSQYSVENSSNRPDSFVASYRVKGGRWQKFQFQNKQGG